MIEGRVSRKEDALNSIEYTLLSMVGSHATAATTQDDDDDDEATATLM